MLEPFIGEAAGKPRRTFDGPAAPWMNYLAIAVWTPFVGLFAFASFRLIMDFTTAERLAPTTWGILGIAFGALLFGVVLYIVREAVQTCLYPLGEIGVGMAVAATAVYGTTTIDGLARLLAILTGIRIIVDGITRFRKFTTVQSTDDRRTPGP